MKIKGMGGYIVRVINIPPTGPSGLIQHNSEYELLLETELRNYRSVACGTFEEALIRSRRVQSLRFLTPDDDPFAPEALGFELGQEISVYLKRGGLVPAQFDYIANTVVVSVRKINDQKKARLIEIVCTRGLYRRSQTPPGLARESQPARPGDPAHPRTPDPSGGDDFDGGGGDF